MMSFSAFTNPDYVSDEWIERVFEDEEVDPELAYLKADEEMDRDEVAEVNEFN